MNLLKQIFTWWNRQTIGTMIITFFSGKLKGIDEFGNKYYESKSGRRWVIYEKTVEASNIPPNCTTGFISQTTSCQLLIKKSIFGKRDMCPI